MKVWWKSKTVWFNALTGALTLAGIFLQYVDAIGVDPVSAGRAGLLLSLFVAIGNFALRFWTTKAVGSAQDVAMTDLQRQGQALGAIMAEDSDLT